MEIRQGRSGKGTMPSGLFEFPSSPQWPSQHKGCRLKLILCTGGKKLNFELSLSFLIFSYFPYVVQKRIVT